MSQRRYHETLYMDISAQGQAWIQKVRKYVHLASINMLSSDSVQCRRGLYFEAWALYLSF